MACVGGEDNGRCQHKIERGRKHLSPARVNAGEHRAVYVLVHGESANARPPRSVVLPETERAELTILRRSLQEYIHNIASTV